MTTSNKIILGLAASISVYLLAAFTEIRVKGTHDGVGMDMIDHVTAAPDFKYLKVVGMHMKFEFADESSFNVQTVEDDEIPAFEYHMSGDTLVLDKFDDQEGRRSKLIVRLDSSTIKGIFGVDSYLTIRNDAIDSLEITLVETTLMKSTSKPALYKYLKISANKSYVRFKDSEFETLYLASRDSRLQIDGEVQNLEGYINDHSNLSVKAANISLSRDNSSRLIIQ